MLDDDEDEVFAGFSSVSEGWKVVPQKMENF